MHIKNNEKSKDIVSDQITMSVAPALLAAATVKAAQVIATTATRQLALCGTGAGTALAVGETKINYDTNAATESKCSQLENLAEGQRKSGLIANATYNEELARETRRRNDERIGGGRLTQGIYDFCVKQFSESEKDNTLLKNRNDNLDFLQQEAFRESRQDADQRALRNRQQSEHDFSYRELEREKNQGDRYKEGYIGDAVSHQRKVHDASTALQRATSTINNVSNSLEESSVGKGLVNEAQRRARIYHVELLFSAPQKSDLTGLPPFVDKITGKIIGPSTENSSPSPFGDKITGKITGQSTEDPDDGSDRIGTACKPEHEPERPLIRTSNVDKEFKDALDAEHREIAEKNKRIERLEAERRVYEEGSQAEVEIQEDELKKKFDNLLKELNKD